MYHAVTEHDISIVSFPGGLFAFKFGMILCRIKRRIWQWHDGFGLAEKRIDQCIEFSDEFRFLCCAVGLLADVIAQIELHVAMPTLFTAVKETYELPVTTMHGNSGREPVGQVV